MLSTPEGWKIYSPGQSGATPRVPQASSSPSPPCSIQGEGGGGVRFRKLLFSGSAGLETAIPATGDEGRRGIFIHLAFIRILFFCVRGPAVNHFHVLSERLDFRRVDGRQPLRQVAFDLRELRILRQVGPIQQEQAR